MSSVKLVVYGAETKCASCVNLPSSKETLEWLQAAISRKFPTQAIEYHYVDIHAIASVNEERFAQKVILEDLFYPVVVINDEIVAEGNPKLSHIFAKIEALL